MRDAARSLESCLSIKQMSFDPGTLGCASAAWVFSYQPIKKPLRLFQTFTERLPHWRFSAV
jgi:hypothetical protein